MQPDRRGTAPVVTGAVGISSGSTSRVQSIAPTLGERIAAACRLDQASYDRGEAYRTGSVTLDHRVPTFLDINTISTEDLHEIVSARRMAEVEPWPELPLDCLVRLDDPLLAEAMRGYVESLQTGRPPYPVDLPELWSIGGVVLAPMVADGLSIESVLIGLLDLAAEAGLDPIEAKSALAAGIAGGGEQ